MYRLIKSISFIAFIFIAACSNQNRGDNNPAREATFIQYLEENFNEEDLTNERMFIIIPCTGCKGCDQSVYSLFTGELAGANDFTLIVCDPVAKDLLAPAGNADNIKYDLRSKMAEYYFGYGYPTCFVVKDNKVVTNYSLTPDVIHWINKYNESRNEQ